jgi:hypothetical protein
MNINCRCRTRIVVKGLDPTLRVDNETGEAVKWQSYDEWAKGKRELEANGGGKRELKANGGTKKSGGGELDPYKGVDNFDANKYLKLYNNKDVTQLKGLSVDQVKQVMSKSGQNINEHQANKLWWEANGKPALVKTDRTDFSGNRVYQLAKPEPLKNRGNVYESNLDLLKTSESWRAKKIKIDGKPDVIWGEPAENCQTIVIANEWNARGGKATMKDKGLVDMHNGWVISNREATGEFVSGKIKVTSIEDPSKQRGWRSAIVAADRYVNPQAVFIIDEIEGAIKVSEPTRSDEFLKQLPEGVYAVTTCGHVYTLIKKGGNLTALEGQKERIGVEVVNLNVLRKGRTREEKDRYDRYMLIAEATRFDNAWLDESVLERMLKDVT